MKIELSTIATLDSGRSVTLSKATLFIIDHLMGDNCGHGPQLIAAIKFVRLEHGLGLRESKDIVDYLRDNQHLLRQP